MQGQHVREPDPGRRVTKAPDPRRNRRRPDVADALGRQVPNLADDVDTVADGGDLGGGLLQFA